MTISNSLHVRRCHVCGRETDTSDEDGGFDERAWFEDGEGNKWFD